MNTELIDALQTIIDWSLPDTGEFWDAEKTRPVSYEGQYGSAGVRAYMRIIALLALDLYLAEHSVQGLK